MCCTYYPVPSSYKSFCHYISIHTTHYSKFFLLLVGKHLAEHSRNVTYPKVPNFVLWVLAEISIVACDIHEVIGMVFALNIPFQIPVWIGVLLTRFCTLVLLALGLGSLNLLLFFLSLQLPRAFLGSLAMQSRMPKKFCMGFLFPNSKGNGATGLAISLLGAMTQSLPPLNFWCFPGRSRDPFKALRSVEAIYMKWLQGLKKTNVQLVLNWGGEWKSDHSDCVYGMTVGELWSVLVSNDCIDIYLHI